MTFEEIENHVINEVGFHRHFDCALPGADYGTDDVSEGILFASSDDEFARETSEAAKRFYRGDFGDFYKWDEWPIPGWEWGSYPSKYGEILCHREASSFWFGLRTITLFPFER